MLFDPEVKVACNQLVTLLHPPTSTILQNCPISDVLPD